MKEGGGEALRFMLSESWQAQSPFAIIFYSDIFDGDHWAYQE